MAPAFVLILLLWIDPANPAVARQPQETLEACMAAATLFLRQEPEDFGAKAISATCVKQGKPGDPA